MANMWVSVGLLMVLTVASTLSQEQVDCSNYELKVKKLEVCPGVDDSILTIQDFNVTLTDNCTLVPTGCISRKAYATAMIKYEIRKGFIFLKGELDACKEIANISPDVDALIEPIKAYTVCPASEAKVCGDDNVNVSIMKVLEYLKFARGRVEGTINVDHDTGKSCIQFVAELKEKNPGPKGKSSRRKKVIFGDKAMLMAKLGLFDLKKDEEDTN